MSLEPKMGTDDNEDEQIGGQRGRSALISNPLALIDNDDDEQVGGQDLTSDLLVQIDDDDRGQRDKLALISDLQGLALA